MSIQPEKIYPAVVKVARLVDWLLLEELGLMAPEAYDVEERDGRVYMIATFNPLAIGRSLTAYEHPDVARRISQALDGHKVVITKKTGTRYVILLAGSVSLPKSVDFPGFGLRDTFRLGMGMKGEIELTAGQIKNVLIGAGQGAGKSVVQKLLVHQARAFGWKLYLADPDGHTFNPDIWNSLAAAPVASSPADLMQVLDRVHGELADRVAMFRNLAASGIPPVDLDAYNQIASTPLPRIALDIDEANSYLGDKRIFALVADLLRRGRKWGLHVFLGGHEWHKETVGAELNDMLQTRIGLTVATEQTGTVVLRSSRWGKWVMGKPAGRGVLRTNNYQPMQFYLVTDDMEREWLGQSVQAPAPLPEKEALLVKRSLAEAEGKMTIGLLTQWGLGQQESRRLMDAWETRGWLTRDTTQGNARVITPKLVDLLTNRQSQQSPTNPYIWRQSLNKAQQSLLKGAERGKRQ